MATRQTLIDAIAKDGDMKKRSALCVLDAVLDNIAIELKKDGTVQIAGFGTFRIETRPARTGRNPRTGELIPIEARQVVTFHASQKLKDQVQGVATGDGPAA